MLSFIEFRTLVSNHMKTLLDTNVVFQTDVEDIVEFYLESFPEGTNEVHVERREYDCNTCNKFLRRFGNIVAIDPYDYSLNSIWNFAIDDKDWLEVTQAMHEEVTSAPITNAFHTNASFYGEDPVLQTKRHIREWNHFTVDLKAHKATKPAEEPQGRINESVVNRRLLEEALTSISMETAQRILTMIENRQLYRSSTKKNLVRKFIETLGKYQSLSVSKRENFLWYHSNNGASGQAVARITNDLIGQLLVNVSSGEVSTDNIGIFWQSIANPNTRNVSQSRPSQTNIKVAQDFVKENGYMSSIKKKHISMDDIPLDVLLFNDRTVKPVVLDELDAFSKLAGTGSPKPHPSMKEYDVTISEFLSEILPTTKHISLYMDNNIIPHRASLIRQVDENSPSFTKWDNPFTLIYAGSYSDANTIHRQVEKNGGKTTGVIGASLSWNFTEHQNKDDLDLHVLEPDGNLIHFLTGVNIRHDSSGILDQDIINPKFGVMATENITYSDVRRMPYGVYRVMVHRYSDRKGVGGFMCKIHTPESSEIVAWDNLRWPSDNKVHVGDITYSKDGWTISNGLVGNSSIMNFWELRTNEWYPVNLITETPAHWGDNKFGPNHIFFGLPNAYNDENIRAMHNEFLNSECYPHRRVLQSLHDAAPVTPSTNQVSGISVSEDIPTTINFMVEGANSGIFKVQF